MSQRIAAEVRAHVARQGIHQSEIAEALGVSQSWVSKRMTGLRPFTVADLDVICQLLNVTLLELVEGATPPEPNERVLDRRTLRQRTIACTDTAPFVPFAVLDLAA